MASLLDEQLSYLFSSLPEANAIAAVEILTKLYNNIQKCPDQDQYRRVRIDNKRFNECVWCHQPAMQFLLLGGWVEAGEFIVYIGDNAQVALDSLGKVTRQPEPIPNNAHVSPSIEQFNDDDTQAKERQVQIKLLKEHQQKVAEEKKRIADQIKADRQESAQKETRSSQSRVLSFGSNINRFEDIGVDLNKGG